MTSTDLLGLTAGFLTTIAFIPQIARIWRTRSAADISIWMFTLFTIGVVLWLIYSIRLGEFPMILANSMTLLFASIILALRLFFGSSRPSGPSQNKM